MFGSFAGGLTKWIILLWRWEVIYHICPDKIFQEGWVDWVLRASLKGGRKVSTVSLNADRFHLGRSWVGLQKKMTSCWPTRGLWSVGTNQHGMFECFLPFFSRGSATAIVRMCLSVTVWTNDLGRSISIISILDTEDGTSLSLYSDWLSIFFKTNGPGRSISFWFWMPKRQHLSMHSDWLRQFWYQKNLVPFLMDQEAWYGLLRTKQHVTTQQISATNDL